MANLTVGTGKNFTTLAAAITASAAGDTILIDAGTYIDDFASITHPLTIQGVHGMAHLLAQSEPPNGKAILTVAADLTIDNLEFSGATVPDGNGAGIRYEGGRLTITNSWFHNNQNGILAASSPTGTISIDRSEFNNNGFGDGQTHNLYVNDIARLTITNSYFHDVSVGHEIKSRARETIITNNRIADGPDLSASYSIDLPDGGVATVTGNIIEKGEQAQNRTFIHFGGERDPSYDDSSLLVQNNTFINNQTGGPPTGVRNVTVVSGANAQATITGNTFYAVTAAQVAQGRATISGNTFATGPAPAIDTSRPLTTTVPCFVRGTSLATPTGEIAVEALAVGDFLATISGVAMQVRWVGHRVLDCRRHPRPWDVLPVRVRAGALQPGQPHRDLCLSPDHAVYVDGVLIPVRYLINGATVVQEEVDAAHYFHVELADADGQAAHTVLLAEGLAAESFLDTGNRGAFTHGAGANGGEVAQLYPDFARAVWDSGSCAPLVVDGDRVLAVRRRLLARAAARGWQAAAEPLLSLEVDGRRLLPERGADAWLFNLPAGATLGIVRSRRFVPAHMAPDSDDWRCLGVAVAAIMLDGTTLDLATLDRGWHGVEPGLCWTDGAGEVGLAGARQLRIQLGLVGRYWADDGAMAVAVAA